MCCGLRAMTSHTRAMNPSETIGWNRSDIELTKTRRGFRHLNGSARTSGCSVTPNPGPLVFGLPSRWYLLLPIAFRRLASVRA